MTGEQHEHSRKKKARRGGKPQAGPGQNPEGVALAEKEEAPVHTVGKTLRAAREAQNLSLEDVCSAINVRVVQLQAIEEDRVDQLPGMTYAVGFVRSYAQFLKLDAQEVVADFKREHADEPAAKTALQFSEPIVEDKLPGPAMIAASLAVAVLLFFAWSWMSSSDEGVELAGKIPPAPAVGTVSGQPTLADAQPLAYPAEGGDAALAEDAAAPPAVTAEAGVEEMPAGETSSAQAEPEPAATEMVVRPAARTTAEPPVTPPQVINVKRSQGRIVIEASQRSWVQISDASGKVVYKKVMAQGEQFFVPDQKGMTLVTSNAGGLDIVVDGVRAQKLGRAGEIIRGISLDPEELKKRRIRVRD